MRFEANQLYQKIIFGITNSFTSESRGESLDNYLGCWAGLSESVTLSHPDSIGVVGLFFTQCSGLERFSSQSMKSHLRNLILERFDQKGQLLNYIVFHFGSCFISWEKKHRNFPWNLNYQQKQTPLFELQEMAEHDIKPSEHCTDSSALHGKKHLEEMTRGSI